MQYTSLTFSRYRFYILFIILLSFMFSLQSTFAQESQEGEWRSLDTTGGLNLGSPSPILEPTAPELISLIFDSPASVKPGETFEVSVVARNISDPGLYGVQFEINYDPTLISAGNLQANPNLSFIVTQNADNTAGKIRLVASQQGKVSGLTGDVTLLSFEATAADTVGTVTLSFENEKFSDAQIQGFDIVSENYSLEIAEEPTPIPTEEPTPVPTEEPTSVPTEEPTPIPTEEPTSIPTEEPTPVPTEEPTPVPTEEPTPIPTEEPTPIPTEEPTPEPTTSVISGQVILAGRTGNDWSGATVTIAAGEQLGITDTTGNFNIANVPAGLTTSITANASGYLSAVCTDVTVAAPQTDLTSVVLLSGDINDDEVVDIVDATAAGASFGQTGSNLPADITRDEIVDIFDIVAVSLNFGEAGSQTWSCLAPAPEPDPTATPEPAGGEILWSADHETGDISQWEEGQGQAIFNSNTPPGTSDIHITTDVAHSGQYALKLSITGATDGKSQGARIFRRWLDSNASPPIPLPDEAYYSAWYFFPQTYVPAEWWNIFQFKSRGEASLSMFSFNIDTSESNKMELYVYDKILGTAHSQDGTPLYISPGEWVHIEAYVKKSHLPNGRLTVWLNGQEIIDAQNIQTLRNEGDRLHWSLNNYTDNITPSDPVIYADDAVISTRRVGAN